MTPVLRPYQIDAIDRTRAAIKAGKRARLRLNGHDLIGKRFGMLSVLEWYCSDGGQKWRCRCDCGKLCVRSTSLLNRRDHHSCGCVPRVKSHVGDRLRDYQKSWRLANKERLGIAKREYSKRPEVVARRKANWWKQRDAHRVRWSAWVAKNPERRKKTANAWAKRNPEYFTNRQSARRTSVPKWVDRNVLNAIYKNAKSAGLDVDHIVPLIHPKVCGLHVPWNLQLLTKAQNRRKGNRWPNQYSQCN